MAIYVEFDEKVSQLAGGAAGTEVNARTIHEALIQVARAYPSLHMFNCDGELRGILRVWRNGQPATVTEALEEGDTLRLSVK